MQRVYRVHFGEKQAIKKQAAVNIQRVYRSNLVKKLAKDKQIGDDIQIITQCIQKGSHDHFKNFKEDVLSQLENNMGVIAKLRLKGIHSYLPILIF